MRRGIGRLRAGGGIAVAPPSSTNMVAWYRKGTGITTSGSAVTAWADQTGLGGRDYTQATGANQPALQGSGTILFDGASHFLRTAAFTLVQPYTRYLRVKQVSWTATDYFGDGFSLNSGVITQTGTTPTMGIYAGSAIDPTSGALAVGVWGSVAAVFNGAASVLQVDATTSAVGSPGASNPGGLTLAASGGAAGSFGNIEVAEEIVYSVAHDATQRAAVIAYLNTR